MKNPLKSTNDKKLEVSMRERRDAVQHVHPMPHETVYFLEALAADLVTLPVVWVLSTVLMTPTATV